MKTRLLCFAAVLFLITSPDVRADTCTWIGGDGLWTTPAGWACGHVPTDADTAVINSGNTVTLDSDATVLDFTLQNSSTLAGSGDLTITGTMTWGSGGSMEGTGETILAATSVLDATDGTVLPLNRTLHNSGTATCGADIQGSGLIVNASGASFEAGAGIGMGCDLGADFENQEGAIFRLPDATSDLSGTMANAGNIEIFALFRIDGLLTSTGVIELDTGELRVSAGGLVIVSGILIGISGTVFDVVRVFPGGDLTITSSGIVDVFTFIIFDGVAIVEPGGQLIGEDLIVSGSVGFLVLETGTEAVVLGNFACSNSGTVQGEGTLVASVDAADESCTVAPGASPGIFTVEGNYVNPILEIELGGLVPGTEHDQLVVTGDATIDGTLRVFLEAGYIPSVGDTYTILTAASTTGSFDVVELPSGIEAAVDVQSDHVNLIVTNVTVANEPDATPTGFTMEPIYPNPFNDSATVTFTLDAPRHIRISLFDMLGREIEVLVEGVRLAGEHEIVFDGQGVPSGVYLVRMEAEGFVQTRRITLLR